MAEDVTERGASLPIQEYRSYPDGLYLGVGYRSPSGRDWKLDIWFVDEPDRQPDLAHRRTPRKALLEAAASRAGGAVVIATVRVHAAGLGGGEGRHLLQAGEGRCQHPDFVTVARRFGLLIEC